MQRLGIKKKVVVGVLTLWGILVLPLVAQANWWSSGVNSIKNAVGNSSVNLNANFGGGSTGGSTSSGGATTIAGGTASQGMNFKQLVGFIITGIFDPLTLLVMALTVLYFMWGLFKYVKATASGDEKAAGKSIMIYGILALFIMVSVWGLVNVLITTFGFTTSPIL